MNGDVGAEPTEDEDAESESDDTSDDGALDASDYEYQPLTRSSTCCSLGGRRRTQSSVASVKVNPNYIKSSS